MIESLWRNGRGRLASAGVLVLLALSLAAAWGRKPPKEPNEVTVVVNMRRISTGEVMSILREFPKLIPGWLTPRQADTNYVAHFFPFSEVTAAELVNALPAVRFYKGLEGVHPPYPYLMAVAWDKRYAMPGGFGQLLIDKGLTVGDRNFEEMARAFVLLEVAAQPVHNSRTGDEDNLDSVPPVTFMDATMKSRVVNMEHSDAEMTVRVNGQTEEWYFSYNVRPGRFDLVGKSVVKGPIK